MKRFFIILLALALLLKAMPDSPPDTSKTYAHVDGAYGILVSAEQNTYLEVEDGYLGDCKPNDCYAMRLYYTKVGGWFQSTERTLIMNVKNVSSSDKVLFRKVNGEPLSPIKIYIDSDPSKKRFYVFTPPSIFEQVHSIMPVIIK
ncbi:MAG: hypothetical protein EOO37_03545 [Cytophagaceae bacterium]|nr:MAG: hypothetical protein EOO37_03545 [Cytophagaceae bacterium]